MIDEKSAPPAYVAPPQQQQYSPPQQGSSQAVPPPVTMQPPPGPPPVQGQPGGYPPAQMAMNAGQQYQQQLFALCAAGNHDETTKYGVFGIIMAIVCFPCGLICLFTDTERRCARCGVRLDK